MQHFGANILHSDLIWATNCSDLGHSKRLLFYPCADQVPGEVASEGDGGVTDPADLAVRCVRDHKVLLVQPGRDVGGRQWLGCDKKTKPVEVDRQTEGKIVSFSLLH